MTSAKSGSAVKSKGKAKGEVLEILTNANLKLKPGVHYALIGRNGSGKSSKCAGKPNEFGVVDGCRYKIFRLMILTARQQLFEL